MCDLIEMEKLSFMLETLQQLQQAAKRSDLSKPFDAMHDSVAHTAPEVMDRCWHLVYAFCIKHLQDRKDVQKIYNERIEQYFKL